MTPKQDLENQKEEIQKLGLGAIKNYLVVDPEDVDLKALPHLLQKAKLGMQFEKEMNVNKRAEEMNQIRIWKLTLDDKKEIAKYVKIAMPQYCQMK